MKTIGSKQKDVIEFLEKRLNKCATFDDIFFYFRRRYYLQTGKPRMHKSEMRRRLIGMVEKKLLEVKETNRGYQYFLTGASQ